jgi:hypothetical protein
VLIVESRTFRKPGVLSPVDHSSADEPPPVDLAFCLAGMDGLLPAPGFLGEALAVSSSASSLDADLSPSVDAISSLLVC